MPSETFLESLDFDRAELDAIIAAKYPRNTYQQSQELLNIFCCILCTHEIF